MPEQANIRKHNTKNVQMLGLCREVWLGADWSMQEVHRALMAGLQTGQVARSSYAIARCRKPKHKGMVHTRIELVTCRV